MQVGVHAATDVTGFGLLGHLHEMLEASGVGARLSAGMVPVLPGAADLAARGAVAGGTARNLEWLADKIRWAPQIDEVTRILLADAQTSGGLLIAAPPTRAEALRAALRARGVETVVRIGTIIALDGTPIDVQP